MATDYNEQLDESIASERKLTLTSGKVANFGYNDTAYACDNVAGVATYNYSQDQNVPLGEAGVLNTTSDLLAKGVRSQASSLTRMTINHFFGRTSYNVNKLADHLLSLFRTVKNFIKESDTSWSATTEYEVGDLVYFITTVNNKPCKRTFFCIQESLNLPPIDSSTGGLINTSYWTEISGNVVNLLAQESVRTKQGVVEQDLVVHGNLYVDGNTTTTTEAQVATTGDFIVTRESNASPMSAGDYSGLAVNNYDTGKMATITADNCGEWRVSDSATVSSVTYTDLSAYEGIFYEGLTRTVLTSYPTHVMTNVSMLEMLDVVYYDGGYYKKEGADWYGTVTVVNNAFNKGSLITDSALITALNALTPSSLVYYITVTDNAIDPSNNQPLLTRAESACFNNGDLLRWDSENRTAVKVPSPTCNNQKLVSRIDSTTHCVSYAWTDASAVDNATCFAGCTYACAKADFRNYTPSHATNTTCFNGCTYACAKADFRNYTPSNATCFNYYTYTQACTDIRTGLVSISNTSTTAGVPLALCTGSCTVGKSTACSLTFTPSSGILCAPVFCGCCVSTKCSDGALMAGGYCKYGSVYVTKIFETWIDDMVGAVVSWTSEAKQCDLFNAIHCNFDLQSVSTTASSCNTVYTGITGTYYTGAELMGIKWDRCETPLNYDLRNRGGDIVLTAHQNCTCLICAGRFFIVASKS